MKQAELLGKLMPGHPDILPIIENILQQSHRIWSQFNGVELGKYWSLEREFGSR